MERCAQMAKRALLRPVGEPNPQPHVAAIEEELLERINKLGIGPAGFGGTNTRLGSMSGSGYTYCGKHL